MFMRSTRCRSGYCDTKHTSAPRVLIQNLGGAVLRNPWRPANTLIEMRQVVQSRVLFRRLCPGQPAVDLVSVESAPTSPGSPRSATPQSTSTAATKPPPARLPADSDPSAPPDDEPFRILFRSSSQAICRYRGCLLDCPMSRPLRVRNGRHDHLPTFACVLMSGPCRLGAALNSSAFTSGKSVAPS
jgi:hypothetical protein